MVASTSGFLFLTPLADAVIGPEVDEHVDEGVHVGDGLGVAQLGPLDAQCQRLRVDALGGGALAVSIRARQCTTTSRQKCTRKSGALWREKITLDAG